MAHRLVKPLIDLVERWMARRRPKGRLINLNHKNIYIFPTAAGWVYFVVCLILYLVATNYENNLIYGVSFLLISLGILTINYTFFNLSGLNIKAFDTEYCFVGEMAEFRIKADADNLRHYEAIKLSWKGEEGGWFLHLEPKKEQLLSLYIMTAQRGRLAAPQIRIETVYPFGLLRAWSSVDLEMSTLVYPKPHKGRLPKLQSVYDGYKGVENKGDDFAGLDAYQEGTPLKHVAWKQYAQGRGLLTKIYAGQENHQNWLSWNEWPELSRENRLSVIAYWALTFEQQGHKYGLLLPSVTIKPSYGSEHLKSVLVALALFDSRHFAGAR